MVHKWMTPKRIVALLLAALVIGGVWYLASPLFVTTTANAPPPSGFTEVVKQGMWRGVDSVHFAEGTAKILTDSQDHYVLRLEDFHVQNGPDIEFFLSTDGTYDGADLRLGNVPATSGNYNVPIPEGTDVASVDYAIIWCVPFGVLFGTAQLA